MPSKVNTLKTIKFSRDKSEFAYILRKNVNNYFKEKGISTKGNWKIAVKSIVFLSIYFIPFIDMLIVPLQDWVIFLLAVLMGIGMAGVGMNVMHDAIHESISSKMWVNKILGYTMCTMGSTVFNWKIQHNIMHHTFTNIDGFDEDIESRGIIRFSKNTPLKRIHRFQHFYAFFLYSFMTLAKLVNDFGQLYKYNKNGITEMQRAKTHIEFIKLIGVKIVYFFVILGLPLIISDLTWWQILSVFVIMHLVASIIMSIVFQLAHIVEDAEQPLPDVHGKIDTDWVIHQLQTTANFARNNRILSWFIGGLNFQIEHHLFPNISHVHYRNISYIVERTANEFGLNYNLKPSFYGAVLSHLRILKQLGREVPNACPVS